MKRTTIFSGLLIALITVFLNSCAVEVGGDHHHHWHHHHDDVHVEVR